MQNWQLILFYSVMFVMLGIGSYAADKVDLAYLSIGFVILAYLDMYCNAKKLEEE